ncbi:MAG: hypothetical protein Tsb009_01440 [Planctomycetaceae bacterium]
MTAMIAGLAVIGFLASGLIDSAENEEPTLEVERKKSEPITKEEAEQVAKQLEQAVQKNDPQTYYRLVNLNDMVDVAAQGLNIRERSLQSFKNGMRQRGKLLEMIQKQISNKGSYVLLRVRQKNGEHRALFRLLSGNDGGLNYHEYVLTKQQGVITVGDLYIYSNGENVTKSIRRTLIPIAAHENRRPFSRLEKSDRDFFQNIKKISQISVAIQSGRSQLALNLIASLPQSLQKQKFIMLFRLMAALEVENDNEFLYAYNALKKHYPGDPSLELFAIDYYVFRKEHDKALAAIDRLDQTVGGDPHLNVLRRNLKMMKQFKTP